MNQLKEEETKSKNAYNDIRKSMIEFTFHLPMDHGHITDNDYCNNNNNQHKYSLLLFPNDVTVVSQILKVG